MDGSQLEPYIQSIRNLLINQEALKARIAELEAEVKRLRRDQKVRIDAQLMARGIAPHDG